jgi:hypothetical protein
MLVQDWLFPRLSELFNCHPIEQNGGEFPLSERMNKGLDDGRSGAGDLAKIKAEGEWFAALASLEEILLSQLSPSPAEVSDCQGLVLSGPGPVLSNGRLVALLQTGIFSLKALQNLALMPFQLEGAPQEVVKCPVMEFPLSPFDALNQEQFCLVFTSQFALLMVLGEDGSGLPAFHFSFEPEMVQRTWDNLRSRLLLSNCPHLGHLESIIRRFPPPTPDYRLVSNFSRRLLKNLPNLGMPTKHPSQPKERKTEPHLLASTTTVNPTGEVELLQALTHEIRTPLTTIRTLTRLLLKRAKVSPDVVKRLEMIDQECTEQIDRMDLIFRAVELETAKREVQLTSISLEEVLRESIPRWQRQAQRRNVLLDVVLPHKLPMIVSDPAMLDKVLGGLMEKFARSLPNGGKIKVKVTTAGNQLKLEFFCPCLQISNSLKALGQLLMFQPETGSLSLSLNVTKNLFQALGSKLTVRHHPEYGEVFTIFLPLGTNVGGNANQTNKLCSKNSSSSS